MVPRNIVSPQANKPVIGIVQVGVPGVGAGLGGGAGCRPRVMLPPTP
jgi:hypothetical protein